MAITTLSPAELRAALISLRRKDLARLCNERGIQDYFRPPGKSLSTFLRKETLADKLVGWVAASSNPLTSIEELTRAMDSMPKVKTGEVEADEAEIDEVIEKAEAGGDEATLLASLKQMIAKAAPKSVLDEAKVRDVVQKTMATFLKEMPAKEIVVKIGDAVAVKIDGLTHEAFEDVLKTAQARIPGLLVGPAGCGKSHLVSQIAQAMALPFYFQSCSAGMSEGALLGRLLPTGDSGRFEYAPAEFVKAYEEGGVFLLDEIDAADANVLLVINSALANGHMSVPSRLSKPTATRHQNFVFVAAANTFGLGADRQYVGRSQLDAATLDRMLIGTVEMGYDPKMEKALVGSDKILNWGAEVRAALKSAGIRRICSTRTLVNAAKAEAAGIAWRKRYFSGWKEDELARIPNHLR